MKSFYDLHSFMSHPLQFLDQKFQEKKGPIDSLRLGPKRFHLIFDPNLAQEILVNRSNVFIQNKAIFNRIKPITGEKGVVQLSGEESREVRKKVRPMFTSANLAEMNEIVKRNTKLALDELGNASTLDVSRFMADLVLKNAFSMFLGIDLSSADEMASEFKELNILCGRRMVSSFALPLFFPNAVNRRIKFLRRSLRSKIQTQLLIRKPQRTNVHSVFYESETLIDQCMTFLFAGHETTASSLSFSLLLLGNHPEYCKKIREGGEEEALRVYKEALRLFPPAYMLAREASERIVLAGVDIRKGDQIIIGLGQIHRHPSFHEFPLEFRPERFAGEVEAFFPFGLGSKSCIGEKLAYQEAVTILQSFCERFDISQIQEGIKSVPLVTLHPGPNQFVHLKGAHNG